MIRLNKQKSVIFKSESEVLYVSRYVLEVLVQYVHQILSNHQFPSVEPNLIPLSMRTGALESLSLPPHPHPFINKQKDNHSQSTFFKYKLDYLPSNWKNEIYEIVI